MIEQVKEFMETFGQPTSYPAEVPETVFDLRYDLIEEELEELEAAKTIIDVADALGDLVYVIEGAMLIYNVKPTLTLNPYDTVLDLNMDEHFLAEGIANMWVALEQWSLSRMLNEVEFMAAQCGIPLKKVVDEIHASNMSKLGADGKPIYREDGKVLKGPNYFTPNLEKVINEFYAARGIHY